MDERSMQLRVGIVVISALLLTAILILLISDFPNPFEEKKTLYVNFDEAPGVTDGTPVHKSGILVGRVTNVRFRDRGQGVQVTVQIRGADEAMIFENETFQIKGNLLGDATLEVVPSGDPTAEPIPAPAGAVMTGRVVGNPLDMFASMEGDVRLTLQSVQKAGDEVATLADSVNQILNGGNREAGQLVQKAEQAIDEFNLAMKQINGLLGDDALQGDLRRTLEQLPLIMEETQRTLAGAQEVVKRADKNLQNLEGLTEPLGQKGPEIARQIDASLSNLESILSQVNTFSNRLNSDEGTIGQLMNNPDLYHQLNSAATNINRITAELRPIVNDFRVFSDKISRDPGQLGVRGAIRPASRTKFPNFGDSSTPPPPTDWRQPLDEWPATEWEQPCVEWPYE